MHLSSRILRLCFCGIVSVPLAAAAASCKPRQPANSRNTCGLNVQVPNDVILAYEIGLAQLVDTVADCAKICADRRFDRKLNQTISHFYYEADCTSFTYASSNGFCQLIGTPLRLGDYQVDNSSDVRLYDLACFNCGTPCPQPFGQQLLDDGDFQEPLLGPWYTVYGGIGIGKHSARMFQCSSSQTRYQYSDDYGDLVTSVCRIRQAFNHCPGAFYSLSFDYKLPLGDSELRELEWFYDKFSHTTTIQPGSSISSWRSVQVFFPSPTDFPSAAFPLTFSASRGINSTVPKNDVYDLDNVRLTRIPLTFKGKAKAPSMVTNGGFENGQLAPWKIVHPQPSPAFEIVSPGLGSRNALKLFYNPKLQTRPDLIRPLITQAIPTRPGMQYVLTFDYKAQSPDYSLTFSNPHRPGIIPAEQTKIDITSPARNDSTYSVSYPFLAYDRSTNLSILIENPTVEQNGDANATLSVLIDNISVKQISKRIPV